MFTEYSVDLEKDIKTVFNSLSEKDRRHYAGIEAKKLGHGGIAYISALLGCDEKTINRGIRELSDETSMNLENIRNSGGGRKSAIDTHEGIDRTFLDILRDKTAGDPMDEKVKWTNLTRDEIREQLQKKGISVSVNVVKKLLKKHGFVKRKALKKTSAGQHKDRDQQFKKIDKLRKEYRDSSNPIISIDAKKKEDIGNLYREGQLETTETIEVLDHDFPSYSEGKVNLYTIYDIENNESFVNIGTSYDTSEYVCDSIKLWWNMLGKRRYPDATTILILADGGGSNSSRHHIFKESLQKLSNELGIELRMAHYPPYTSKWNPIEHRVFPHITRSLSGVILLTVSILKELIVKTKTKMGLKVFSHLSKKKYELGRKVACNFYEYANIKFDTILGNWNYVINPAL